jgi:hypothetical protein
MHNDASGESLLAQVRDHAAPSVFRPEHLLRETRRQKGLPAYDAPEVCVLDPDGDLVRALRRNGRARLCEAWACCASRVGARARRR